MTTEYRIEFTIQRREDGDDDFEDIGFGSSGAWDTPDRVRAHALVRRAEQRVGDRARDAGPRRHQGCARRARLTDHTSTTEGCRT
jgi:hypothetical protein